MNKFEEIRLAYKKELPPIIAIYPKELQEEFYYDLDELREKAWFKISKTKNDIIPAIKFINPKVFYQENMWDIFD